MPGRKKRGSRNLKIMLSAMGITVLALLILALAAYLLIGGKAVSSETESEQADQETDEKQQYALYQKAHDLYKGDFLNILTSDEWVVFRKVFYKNFKYDFFNS